MLKLSNKTAQLLTSGQVITCACNVVKELIENALDALADVIEVKVEKGGLAKVEVKDNGIGIKASDIQLAAQKHYTSKLTSHSDLHSISTYGFRGEALSSMCEIADVVITTKTEEESYSFVYTLNSDGNVVSKKPSHIAQGTTVTVSNLFKNLPVRKQYFQCTKKVKEQIKIIEALLMAFAISQPNVQFKLVNDRCLIWQKLKCSDEKASFLQVVSITECQLLTLSNTCKTTNIHIKIYFPKKYMKRSSLDRFFLIINKRPIRNKAIEKLVRSVILKMTGEKDHITGWPTLCLIIDVPPSQVDVNINPSKTAVHLSCNDDVINLLQDMFEPFLNDHALGNAPISDGTNTIGNHSNKEQRFKQMPSEPKTSSCMESQIQKSGISNAELRGQMHSVKDMDVCADTALSGGQVPFDDLLKETHLHKDMPKTDTSYGASENLAISFLNTKQSEKLTCENKEIHTSEKENHCINNSAPIKCKQNKNSENSPFHRFIVNEECVVGSRGWSCGSAVTNQDEEIIQPVKIIRPLPSCNGTKQKRPFNTSNLKQSTLVDLSAPSIIKRPRSVFEVSKSSTDKNWEELSSKEQSEMINIAAKEYDDFSKETTKAKKQKERKSFVRLPQQNLCNDQDESLDVCPEISISFDFGKVSHRIEKLCLEQTKSEETMTVVGYLNNYNAAVIKLSKQYFFTNLTRLQESLVFENLSNSFKVPTTELDTLIEIHENNVGTKAYDCLQGLCYSQTSILHPEAEILDERIAANGFKIKQLKNPSNSLHISALATAIPCYGISDLKEILLKICNNHGTNLSHSRPTKCVYYLQSEASRIAQSSPALRCKGELLNALFLLKKNMPWADFLSNLVCFHRKNVFLQLKVP